MKRFKNIIIINSLLIACLITNQSCTTYDTPTSIAGEIADNGVSNAVQRKVLWINIDGAVGKVVKEVMPQRIALMLKNSKYSWDGLSDYRILKSEKNEDPVTWTTMLTGVVPEKHNVVDDSYTPEVNLDPTNLGGSVVYHPNILHYISEADPTKKTLCVTPWQTLNNNMLNNATETVTTDGDESTKNIVLDRLKNRDYSFTLVSFSGMLNAGKAGGFTSTNSNYVAALGKIDAYIGQMLDTIKGRKNAYNEDWLVVVASNHGGSATGHYGGTSDDERNTFGLFYFPHYAEQVMDGKTFEAAYFDKNNSARISDSLGYYSIPADKAYTLEFVMRMNPRSDGRYDGDNWNRIMGKNKWGIYRQRKSVSFRIESTTSTSALERAINCFNDAAWHSYCAGMGVKTLGNRNYTLSYDGQPVASEMTNAVSTIADKSNFTIGGSGIPTSYNVSEIRMWNITFDNRTTLEHASMLDIPATDASYNHLIGYWKLKKSSLAADGITLKNEIAGMPDLIFSNVPVFAKFANTLPAYRSSGNLIFENVLIAPQILYWLRTGVDSSFDGTLFLNNYAAAEEWRVEE